MDRHTMHDTPHVIGINGSLRDDIGTRVAVQRTLDAAAGAGATIAHIDLREWDLSLFDPDTWAAFEDGSIANRDIADRIEELGEDVVAYAGIADRHGETEQSELATGD
nr:MULTISPECIES: hypothetical protein [unclassified Haloarcula]